MSNWRYNKDGHIYFVKPINECGPVKIGFTGQAKKRLSQLLLWSPVDLEFVCFVRGPKEWETRAHKYFAADYIRNEWFAWSWKLHKAIRRLNDGESFVDVIPETDNECPSIAKCRKSPGWAERRSISQQITYAQKRGTPIAADLEGEYRAFAAENPEQFLPAELKKKIEQELARVAAA